MKDVKKKLLIIFVMILSFMGTFLYDYLKGNHLLSVCTENVTGTVTDVTHHSSKHHHGTVATISYYVGDELFVMTSPCDVTEMEGNKVPVHYDPHDFRNRYAYDKPNGVMEFKKRIMILCLIIPIWMFLGIKNKNKIDERTMDEIHDGGEFL